MLPPTASLGAPSSVEPALLTTLLQLGRRPPLWEPGERLFWDDPHISAQMLAAHLNPDTEAASRRPAAIGRIVDWLIQFFELQPDARVLDLGCGPGLYAARLAQRGLRVTGIDYSRRSIRYAQASAAEQGLAIDYRCQDYRQLEEIARYDAALLIYGDYCALPPEQRADLLARIRRALVPHGWLALDVTTRVARARHGLTSGWYAAESGFWRPGPHLVLERGFDYPAEQVFLDQYIVLEAGGGLTVYRNWFQDFTPEMMTAELETAGFAVRGLWGDLAGAPYTLESEWIGLAAQAPA